VPHLNPFFRSTFFERRMLFEPRLRASVPRPGQANVLPIDAYKPAQQPAGIPA
jgi:hypothetical protein